MQFSYSYKNLREREEKIREAEAKSLRMLHDDFEPDWKAGDEPHGTMTFTDEPEPVAITPLERDLAAEVDKLKVKIAELEGKITKIK